MNAFFGSSSLVTITAAFVVVLALPGEARAGCGDGACGRVDWTEVTEQLPNGDITGLKIHGGYAWEASPDGWATHPLAGTIDGYLWLSCPQVGGVADSVCAKDLEDAQGMAGTQKPIMFGGQFYDSTEMQSIQPPFLFDEGKTGTPTSYIEVKLGQQPFNPGICPAALAAPPNKPPATTSSSSSTSSSTSSGSTSGGGTTTSGHGGAGGSGGSSGNGGCSVRPSGGSGGWPTLGVLTLLAGSAGAARRMRRRR